ncbi:KTSC domain-containing protein [Hephaestia caeni]|uniref:KTSC domain-containing protein n=2 Tax=Hephaestia caeni TaxID=645617 RepID=A0A397ND96_9SPHN|nr:KTSC domain-containing protein [Hephaestia caeni]
MVRVTSSAMRDVDYDRARRRLSIRFAQGGWYSYSGVPPRVAAGLLAAPSLGRYFHARIRDRYPFRRQRARPG